MKINITKTKKQLITNTLTGWLGLVCRVPIALIMVPFLLEHLGKNGYGLIGLMGVIVSFSAVADFGLRQALGRELSEKVAKKDSNGFRILSSTALLLYLCIAFVLIVISWLLAPWFVDYFKVDLSLRSQAIMMIRVYGSISLLLSFVTPVFKAGIESFMRFDTINLVTTVSGIVSGVFLIIAIKTVNQSPLMIWVVVMLIMSVLALLLLIILYRKWCFSGKLSFKYIDIRELGSLFQLGGYMYVLQLTKALSERSDPLVISRFFGTAGVAIYNSGARLTTILRPMILTLSTQVHPLTTRYHVLNQKEKQRKTLVLGTRYTLLLGVVASAGILIFAESFCRLWLSNSLGADYLTVASVMKLWAVANLFDYMAAMHWPILLGMKKMRFALAVQVPSAIFNILLSIYLVGYSGWGIPGVLVGTIITGFVRRPIIIWYVSRITGLSIKEYFRSAYIPPAIMFTLLLASFYFFRMYAIHNWSMFVLSVGLFSIYAVLLLIVIERKLVITLWQQWKRR